MINSHKFIKALKSSNIKLVTGVPDSLLKDLHKHLEKIFKTNHVISTNEGSAVGLAIGSYLSTKQPAVVYFQNSGLGNIINPISSLADNKVYGIPMILLIGCRGELKNKKQVKDEPQHKKQGEITLNQLKLLKIPYKIISQKTKNINQIISKIKKKTILINNPVAIVIRKNTFKSENLRKKNNINLNSREKIIKNILLNSPSKSIFVTTTGMISREFYEIKKKYSKLKQKYFLVIGGMGHANQISAGIAKFTKNYKIICLDGDGSILMHLGSLALNQNIRNLCHIILDNSSHDSVGGQPTVSKKINMLMLGKSLGYKYVKEIKEYKLNENLIKKFTNLKQSSMTIIKCSKGNRMNLGRPKESPKILKNNFFESLDE